MKIINKILLILTLSIAFLLISTPLIPAVEYSTVQDVQEEHRQTYLSKFPFFNLLQDLNLEKIIQYAQDTSLTSLEWSSLLHQMDPLEDDTGDIQPLFFPFLGIFIYALIAYVILKVVFTIIRTIGSYMQDKINQFKNKIKAFIQKIVDLITLLLNTIQTIIISVITLLIKMGNGVVNGAILLITFIIKAITAVLLSISIVVLSLFYGVIFILATIWSFFEAIFGIILDIINTILHAKNPYEQVS